MRFLLAVVSVVLVLAAANARNVLSKEGVRVSFNHARNKLFSGKAVGKPSNDGYVPCKRQVTLMYDFSNDISSNLFKKLQDFVENTAFSNFNNFERLVVGAYSSAYIEQKILGFLHNLKDVQDFVDGILQVNADSDIGFLFEDLLDQDDTDLPRTIIILAGKLTDDDVKAADQYVEQLKQQGIFISIIGIQSSVDTKVLDKLADYSYVFDLNSGIPSNIQDVLTKANGCN